MARCLFDEGSLLVAEVDRDVPEAESASLAAEIARRWNCHEALGAILEEVMEECGGFLNNGEQKARGTFDRLRAALALAKR